MEKIYEFEDGREVWIWQGTVVLERCSPRRWYTPGVGLELYKSDDGEDLEQLRSAVIKPI